MGQPAAKQNDQITATDTHIVIVPGTPPVPTPLPHPFVGIIDGSLSSDVKIMGQPAATVGSTATNTPSHIPTPPGVSFQVPPTNKGTILKGSSSVILDEEIGKLTDTAYTADVEATTPRKLLAEEFTGVSCPPCAHGHGPM